MLLSDIYSLSLSLWQICRGLRSFSLSLSHGLSPPSYIDCTLPHSPSFFNSLSLFINISGSAFLAVHANLLCVFTSLSPAIAVGAWTFVSFSCFLSALLFTLWFLTRNSFNEWFWLITIKGKKKESQRRKEQDEGKKMKEMMQLMLVFMLLLLGVASPMNDEGFFLLLFVVVSSSYYICL